jgi:hypothetical protein
MIPCEGESYYVLLLSYFLFVATCFHLVLVFAPSNTHTTDHLPTTHTHTAIHESLDISLNSISIPAILSETLHIIYYYHLHHIAYTFHTSFTSRGSIEARARDINTRARASDAFTGVISFFIHTTARLEFNEYPTS